MGPSSIQAPLLSEGAAAAEGGANDASHPRILTRSPSQLRLCLSARRHRYTVNHSNRDLRERYVKDLFHTLLNMCVVDKFTTCSPPAASATPALTPQPNDPPPTSLLTKYCSCPKNSPTGRFLLVFLSSYLSLYLLFASIYMLQSVTKHCVSNITSFSHALWFSVHTSATIGYGHQTPNPNCTLVNIAVMAEVLMTALLQAAMVGLVFARFSVASSRAATITFSTCIVTRGNTISFRVANLRNHQVLRPRVTLLIVHKTYDDTQEVEYGSQQLALDPSVVWLGLPTVMTHKIDDASPLRPYWTPGDAQATAAALEADEVEFVALLDGVDEMTSKDIQARHSWLAEDLRFDQVFKKVTKRGADGALVVDWRGFHSSSTTHALRCDV